ncbi:hypothetical protein [Pedobacter nutrimenti]|uniref:hypothetical protein n=1 Tax=Pedobacter nutrimenti TaxID=1241337 RepID=UPI00292F9308|nr:hypothetical protein [Pedobacter nutrimenti]
MTKVTEKPKINVLLNVTCLTLLMLDSGGGLRLRNISFLIMFYFAMKGVLAYKSVNKTFLIIYIFFLLSLVPGILTSISNSIPIPQILVWLMAFMLIPLFYFYAKGSGLSERCFVLAGAIFSTVVVLLFFGRLMDIGFIVGINDYISSHSDGFFGSKNFLSGDILPNVYFQGTLSVIICGALSLRSKNYFVFCTILLGLMLAPSRFGFIVLLLWASFLFFRKSLTRLMFLPVIFVLIFMLLQSLPFGKELFSVFTGESDAIDIRNGHFMSVYHVFANNPLYFFFGQGPGSTFFSTGISAIADNIEISQLEYIRKYGVISFVVFCVFYFLPFLSRTNSDIFIKGALVLYFIVSFSNPVLFSIFSMLFLAFVYVKIFDKQQLT